MIETLLSNPYVHLALFVTSIGLAILVGAAAFQLKYRESKLPLATAWVDLDERVQRLRSERSDLEDKIEDLNRRIADRDRLAGEIAGLQERRDALLAEFATLDDARRQIDETKQAAANAATELASQQDALEAVRADHERLSADLEALDRQIADRKRELEKLPEELERDIAALRAQLEALRNEVDTVRAERGQLMAARQELTELNAHMAGRRDERARLETECEALRGEKSRLLDDRDDLAHERNRLRLQVDADEAEARKLGTQVEELTARKAVLEAEVSRLAGERGSGPSESDEFDENIIADLKQPPKVFENNLKKSALTLQEDEALYTVHRYLKELGLVYSPRVINAFHTALKINDAAQLTVLAGVSGTGKSLLPRRYAEAMGIRFLPFAVEPRWDSPQDLLGFYNYIEKRYRATELARAMVYLDPFNTSTLADHISHSDEMMIVLLDEMNLARVEYYFSEFLSRLEARPPWAPDLKADACRDAFITVDIRGRSEGPIQLFAPHNMLFVGTMNDDESTQSLSDKVLDRGNIMQFAAPDRFEQAVPQKVVHPSPILPFKTWKTWCKPPRLSVSDQEYVSNVISQLAKIMQAFGRPFGHRLNAAMILYVANYPAASGLTKNLQVPLADQVEFRILPKLRGLNIEEHTDTFERLERLIGQDLGDNELAAQFKATCDRQRNAGGLFNWRGLTRSEG
jgi:predicted  nucleic acid-binding Zn-ribbon protein